MSGGVTWASIRREHERARKWRALKQAGKLASYSLFAGLIWVSGVIVVAYLLAGLICE